MTKRAEVLEMLKADVVENNKEIAELKAKGIENDKKITELKAESRNR